MSDKPTWLPEIVQLEQFKGDWGRFLNAIYTIFRKDFVISRPIFRGNRLGCKRYPLYDGKEATFWHVIQEGKDEDKRVPDLRRCERVPWIRPVIEHEQEPVIKVWENTRGYEIRICLWLEDFEYLVVLAKREGYIILWTAYPVTESHRKRKLQNEYEVFIKG
jgi:hypothetical protein